MKSDQISNSIGGYKIRNQNSLHFITCTIVEWADIFTRQVYRDIVIDNLKYCVENKGLQLHAWVIMSNHIHLICSASETHRLSDILRDFKKYTSKALMKTVMNLETESRKKWLLTTFESAGIKNIRNKQFQVWKQGNHPVELSNKKIYQQRFNYLHNNPVKAMIVKMPEHYIYSSAGDYIGEPGLIELVKIDEQNHIF